MLLQRFGKAGKKIGNAIYFHKLYYKEHLSESFYKEKLSLIPVDYSFNIIKYTPKNKSITFLNSPDFDTADEPYINHYVTIKNDNSTKFRKYRGLYQIYHHKWLFVADDYPNFNVSLSKKRSLDWGLFKADIDVHKIGYKIYWEKNMIKKLNGVWHVKEQEYTSARTSQNILPAPIKKLIEYKHFYGGVVNLDIGGGKYDKMTLYLSECGIKNIVSDTYNRTKSHNNSVLHYVKKNAVDTVTIFHVLNVIKEREIQLQVIQQAYLALKLDGKAFIYSNYKPKNSVAGKTMADSYQNFNKTIDFLPLVQEVFKDAYFDKKLGMIVGIKH